jgi:hypothetical protein
VVVVAVVAGTEEALVVGQWAIAAAGEQSSF